MGPEPVIAAEHGFESGHIVPGVAEVVTGSEEESAGPHGDGNADRQDALHDAAHDEGEGAAEESDVGNGVVNPGHRSPSGNHHTLGDPGGNEDQPQNSAPFNNGVKTAGVGFQPGYARNEEESDEVKFGVFEDGE